MNIIHIVTNIIMLGYYSTPTLHTISLPLRISNNLQIANEFIKEAVHLMRELAFALL